MQPFLFVSGSSPGLFYLNGRLVGLAGDEPVSVPATPTGAAYLEYRPIEPGLLPVARTIALSRGAVVEGSVQGFRGMGLVAWPGGILEVFFEPEPVGGYADAPSDAGVYIDGVTRQVVTPLDDVAGHAQVATWQNLDGEWRQVNREILWDTPGPKWPDNPRDTAIAAAQAAILGLHGEARGYIAPTKAGVEKTLGSLYGRYDGCTKAVYRPGDCVALVKVIGENLARVDIAEYSCSMLGGSQGDWRLDKFEIV